MEEEDPQRYSQEDSEASPPLQEADEGWQPPGGLPWTCMTVSQGGWQGSR